MIDKTFKNTNGLFVISFKSGDDNPTRNSFDKNYIPLVKIKDLNSQSPIHHFLTNLEDTKSVSKTC